MKIFFAAKSDLGLKRKINEDSFYADEKTGLFMVLDGIGGHRAGEVASKLGLNTIKEFVIHIIKSQRDNLISEYNHNLSREANILKESLFLANKVIYDAARSQPEYYGMGTTVVSLLVGKKRVAIAHVGDSRIYLIRNNSIERLTEDHSLVMEQLKLGIINEEEAEKSEMRNIITRALGADEEVNPTVDEMVPFQDDLFLLCSDGLTDLVSDQEILEIVLGKQGILEQAALALIDKANERGGKDNITTILINFQSPPNKILQWFYLMISLFLENFYSRKHKKNN